MDHFAILRHGKKVKSRAALAAFADHNERRDARGGNIDWSRTHLNLTAIGSGDLVADVEAMIATLDRPPRSNAVLARELLLSATPQWFGGVEGNWNPDRVAAWRDYAVAWLNSEFPGQVVEFVVHLDERSVHGHAVIVPVVEKELGKRGRKPKNAAARTAHDASRKQVRTLDHDMVMGTNRDFVRRHDDFAKAGEPLGLKRGLRGSQSRHKPVRQLYAELDTMAENTRHAGLDAMANQIKADIQRQAAALKVESANEEWERAHAERLLLQRERKVAAASQAGIAAVAAGEIVGTMEDPTTSRRDFRWRANVPPERRNAFLAVIRPAFNEVWELVRRLLALALDAPQKQRVR